MLEVRHRTLTPTHQPRLSPCLDPLRDIISITMKFSVSVLLASVCFAEGLSLSPHTISRRQSHVIDCRGTAPCRLQAATKLHAATAISAGGDAYRAEAEDGNLSVNYGPGEQ